MVDGKLRARTAAWMMLACGLPSVAWAADADAITGRWKDIGRFKGPTLRALASRAPYFHNGSAKDLNEVVRFDDRFGIGFTDQERDDLVAFLKAL